MIEITFLGGFPQVAVAVAGAFGFALGFNLPDPADDCRVDDLLNSSHEFALGSVDINVYLDQCANLARMLDRSVSSSSTRGRVASISW